LKTNTLREQEKMNSSHNWKQNPEKGRNNIFGKETGTGFV
jgi:hypothetical protein